MITLSSKTRLTLLALMVIGATMVVAVEFTGWSRLHAVTLDGESLADWQEHYPLPVDQPLHRLPVNQVAAQLLQEPSVVKVDVDYELPGTLHIATNRFNPVGFVLDRSSGQLWGLNHQGRIVPIQPHHDDWEHPIITGTEAGGLYRWCPDPRVNLVVRELAELRDINDELYRLIEEIDLSSPDYVVTTISGLPSTLRASAGEYCEQTVSFVRFLENYHPEITVPRLYDLRHDNLIVEAGK